MSKRQQQRIEKLLPNGKPRWIRVYDNAGLPGETCDRYTVIFTGHYTQKTGGYHWSVGMSGAPFHPQGVCMHSEDEFQLDCPWPPAVGRKNHLGKRILFDDLPPDCQRVVLSDYSVLWDLPIPPVRS